jgi:hypothetical protein
MYLLRVARLYNKVLLFMWDDPDPVETFLQPARIDWSTHSPGLDDEALALLHSNAWKPLTTFDGRHSCRYCPTANVVHPMFSLLHNGTGANEFKAAKV